MSASNLSCHLLWSMRPAMVAGPALDAAVWASEAVSLLSSMPNILAASTKAMPRSINSLAAVNSRSSTEGAATGACTGGRPGGEAAPERPEKGHLEAPGAALLPLKGHLGRSSACKADGALGAGITSSGVQPEASNCRALSSLPSHLSNAASERYL